MRERADKALYQVSASGPFSWAPEIRYPFSSVRPSIPNPEGTRVETCS